jgi:hypothetical protein
MTHAAWRLGASCCACRWGRRAPVPSGDLIVAAVRWGNRVTCRDWNHFWLNEGAATPDFQRAMERASGADLTAFFHQWVYSADGGV